eukprot:Nitzschia sp. Nitz4//scaffold42_size132992//38047//38739//NITZ4_003387-RA/size132992-processed-gene-0.7-mRNA-1//1//CDS//3329551682//2314//frame0
MATPPPEFICPLTKKLMSDPMMSRYGNHFERSAIMDWLNKGNNYCPITGNPLRPSNLVSDKSLQWKIHYWAKKNGHELEQVEEEEKSSVGFIAVPPEKFICPLTNIVMKDPVCSRNGINFERKAILQWLDEKGDYCPVTNKPLRPAGLISNSKLKWEIEQWQLSTGDSADLMSELELQGKLSKAEMISRDFALSDIVRALTSEQAEPVVPPSATEKQDVLSVLEDVMNTL